MLKKFCGFFLLFCLIATSTGAVNLGLEAGEEAPDFSADNYEGQTIQLADFLSKGPVVLLFYRGGWCPYCNRQLQEYQNHIDDFKALGASIIAVSVDQQTQAAKTVTDQKLGFEVVSNPGAELLNLYNVVYKVPDNLAEIYKTKYNIDLEAYSGRTDYLIAIAATYVIDVDGVIVYAYADEDYKTRPAAAEILNVVEALQ